MGGDGADNNNKEQKQDEDESRPLSGSDIPREIVDQFVECVKSVERNKNVAQAGTRTNNPAKEYFHTVFDIPACFLLHDQWDK